MRARFLFLMLFITAAMPANAALTSVAGHLPDVEFSLTDDNGHVVSEKNYAGKVVLLYFGFTQCASECPLTLARLATILHSMGKEVQVLFVTIDPAHDTPATLHTYLQSFHAPQIAGLTGDTSAIRTLAKQYRVAYQPGGGTIVHSNAIYIFDTKGQARYITGDDEPDESIITTIQQLLHERR